MIRSSFIGKIKSTRVNNIFLVSGEDNGRACWYYLDVEPLKIAMFERVAKNGQDQDLANWGKIMVSGWGDEPPTILKDRIKEQGPNLELSEDDLKQEMFFITNQHRGRPFYSFVSVLNFLAADFKDNCARGGFELTDYGTVVKSGWGEPDEALIELMQTNYNVSKCSVRSMFKKQIGPA